MRTGRTRISPLMIGASANARDPQGSPLSTTGLGSLEQEPISLLTVASHLSLRVTSEWLTDADTIWVW